MPSARNNAGLTFLMNISTSCTVEAITAMKEISLRYGASIVSSSFWMPNAHIELTSITNVTAPPIRLAVSSLAETPRNGQMPRKYASTKLLIRHALTKIDHSGSPVIRLPPRSRAGSGAPAAA